MEKTRNTYRIFVETSCNVVTWEEQKGDGKIKSKLNLGKYLVRIGDAQDCV
jgi:hypothetical protein